MFCQKTGLQTVTIQLHYVKLFGERATIFPKEEFLCDLMIKYAPLVFFYIINIIV